MKTIFSISIILLSLLLFSCSDDDSGSAGLPVARISAVTGTLVGETVSMSGAPSSGGTLTYTWTLVARPAGSSAVLSDPAGMTTSFTADQPGSYRVRLMVSDGTRDSQPVEHTVTAFAAGAAIHVDVANSGIEDGSEAHPYNTIQEALNAAPSGALIKVAGGIYPENIVLNGTNSLTLQGGYQTENFGVRNPVLYPARIQGNNATNVITMEFTGGSGTEAMVTIDGFTVSGGRRGICITDQGNGGLLHANIRNNSVVHNSGLAGGDDYGGGVFLRGAVATVTGNTIASNSCGKGAGLAVFLLDDTRSILILSNTILSNTIRADHGGGVYIGARKGLVSRNMIRNNRIANSYGWGGGMIVDGGVYTGYSDTVCLVLSHNTYTGNHAPSMGGGLYIDEGANVRLHNELIVKNTTADGQRNGGLYVDGPRANGNAKTILENCTIAANTGSYGSSGHAIVVEGGSQVTAKNCIFCNNSTGASTNDFYVADSTLTIDYSLYHTGYTLAGTGSVTLNNSFTADPLFADPDAGDWHLKSTTGRWNGSGWTTDGATSPAIDAGDSASPWNNEPADNGSRVNLGAYGNTPEASKSP